MPYSIGRGKHTCTKVIGVGEVAMHENSDGSYRTVIGDGRTPLNELPTFSGEPRGALRDTFAAAALTGLLAAPTDKDRSSEYWARFSYEIADAMLRERDNHIADASKMVKTPGEPVPPCFDPAWSKYQAWVAQNAAIVKRAMDRAKTNHDAAPAARANAESVAPQPTAGDRSGNPTSHSGTGNTQEPVAWALQHENGDLRIGLYFEPDRAYEYAHACGDTVVPLYRHPQPTLTDEEREAVEVAAVAYAADHGERFAAILRKLLERLHK